MIIDGSSRERIKAAIMDAPEKIQDRPMPEDNITLFMIKIIAYSPLRKSAGN